MNEKEPETTYGQRMKVAFKQRFDVARKKGNAPPSSKSAVVEWLLTPYIEYTEDTNRRPTDFAELAKWYLEREASKRS